jgi:hypothetical protein
MQTRHPSLSLFQPEWHAASYLSSLAVVRPSVCVGVGVCVCRPRENTELGIVVRPTWGSNITTTDNCVHTPAGRHKAAAKPLVGRGQSAAASTAMTTSEADAEAEAAGKHRVRWFFISFR